MNPGKQQLRSERANQCHEHVRLRIEGIALCAEKRVGGAAADHR